MARKRFNIFALLVVLALLLAACGGPAATAVPPTATVGTTTEQPTAMTEEPTAMAEETTTTGEPTAMTEKPTAMAEGDKPMAGKKVTIFGVAADEQARLFDQEFAPFEERTGIDVVYEGNKDFETLILVRVEGNNAPDIAQFAQPGLLADFVRKGKVIDLNTFMEPGYLEKQYSKTFLDLATVDGKMAGLWHNNDVKSLVWYPKDDFDAKGYKVPTTWDEMLALSDKIVADGGTPWCIGIESAGATGWVGTDWVEDIMLRTTTPENYDKWTRGELKFNSPEVKNAFQKMADIWLKEGYVYGGTPSILTTAFGDSPTPMFDNPPKCWLHRQASFITNFFPKDAVVGKDIAYFYLPPIDPQYGKPVLGSGSISAMFNDRPEVQEVMKFLATGESMKVEAQAGVGVAPQKDADPSWYPNEATRGFGTILQEATTFRFDGSDLMPGAVGAGSFWKGIVDYVGGADLDTVLNTIDASWPSQ
ncbi:MAG TPA: ABC transporter substrate-binding protein [Chloroflexia bacterium]|jgi:alpha-glucoside transport system substrate-binding protein